MIPSYAGGVPPGLTGSAPATIAGDAITGNIEPEARLLGKQGVDADSTLSDITLGQGNYFQVTGAGSVLSISSAGWIAGSVVVLHFLAGATVVHNSGVASFEPIALAGAANFVATAGDTLTVLWDGGFWREIARTVI